MLHHGGGGVTDTGSPSPGGRLWGGPGVEVMAVGLGGVISSQRCGSQPCSSPTPPAEHLLPGACSQHNQRTLKAFLQLCKPHCHLEARTKARLHGSSSQQSAGVSEAANWDFQF